MSCEGLQHDIEDLLDFSNSLTNRRGVQTELSSLRVFCLNYQRVQKERNGQATSYSAAVEISRQLWENARRNLQQIKSRTKPSKKH